MSELIDREATVKQICKMGEMVGGHDRDVVIAIALFVQDDKTAFPTVERPQWIPCSERLPEDPDTKRIYASKTYQVTTDDGRTMVLRWCKTEIRGKIVMRWEWHDGRIYHGNVLAWKPLSEPYRKEGEAE